MITYESQTTVRKPVDQVFKAATDIDLYSKWTEMTDTRVTTGNGMGPGARIDTSIHMGPMNVKMTFEVSEFETGKSVAYKTVSKGPMIWNARYDFTSLDDGSTQIHQNGEISLQGIWKLMEPLMSGEVKKGEAKELERLKDYLETSG